MPLQGAGEARLHIDNQPSAEAIREFTEHIGKFQKPLLIKTEYDPEEHEELTNERM
jgi:hypothetical protein